ncbi:PASTA domain-containing protein [Kribbella antibiotica]|uniref:PASTA domain-containing protein n=1 Tax=Kribbella antibiotica TaxID=190195 RepID=A0A4R4YKP0_9ACTN|nr:PASTA domain-containing protein [Kribbella antibiotica]TDD44970.1 PASTA domain-containing protein [Kribbella antibiotica]
MSDSYWRFCYLGADGEEVCHDLYAELEPGLDEVLTGQVKELGGLQEAVGRVTDSAVRIRLVEVLDDAAMRLNTGLPEGFVLRRADLAAFANQEEFFGVPGVVGMTHVDAFNTLRAEGYGVKTVWEWTSSAEENTVTDQSPTGGSFNLPPTVVNIWVRTLPPEPVIPDKPVFIPE